MDTHTIVVLEGDETGQDLLEEALRARTRGPRSALEFPRFDLSLESRAPLRTQSYTRARAIAGLGLKAPTTTPEQAGDVGSPNRILREEAEPR